MSNFKKRFAMNVLKKLKLRQLTQADLAKREMNALLGGGTPGCCTCGCLYYYYGGSASSSNSSTNKASGLHSDMGVSTGQAWLWATREVYTSLVS